MSKSQSVYYFTTPPAKDDFDDGFVDGPYRTEAAARCALKKMIKKLHGQFPDFGEGSWGDHCIMRRVATVGTFVTVSAAGVRVDLKDR